MPSHTFAVFIIRFFT